MITFEIIFIFGFGVLLHFTYEWAAKNRLIGYFSVVNQSAWEHLKAIAVPMFLMILLDYSSFGHLNNYWFAKFISMILAVVISGVVLYLYRVCVKKPTFIYYAILLALSAVYATIMFNNILEQNALNLELLGMIGLGVIFVLFALGTAFPLKLSLFEDPETKKYGFGLTVEDLAKRFKRVKKDKKQKLKAEIKPKEENKEDKK